MDSRYRQIQSPKSQVLPGSELALISAKHARALLGNSDQNSVPTQFAPGLLGILQTLGPCPSPAALRAGAIDQDDTAFWVALECCYWRIEPGGLRWMAHDQALAISAVESDQLFAELQPIFAESSARLECNSDGALSLRCARSMATPQAQFPDQLLGAEMKAHLPNLTIWQRWLNEAQMQLAGCQLNQRRAEKALPPINSIWFWGAEEITAPGPTLTLQYDGVDPILRARAAVTGEGAPVRIHDWRDLDHHSLLDKLETLAKTAKLFCSDGYLYERHTLSPLTRLTHWLTRRVGTRR